MLGSFAFREDSYIVYAVFHGEELLECSCGKLHEILRKSRSRVKGELYKVVMYDEVSSYEEGMNLVTIYHPEYPQQRARYNVAVKCLETGEVFKNAYAACLEYDIKTSAMYPHLKKITGHKKVKGMSFEYVDSGND